MAGVTPISQQTRALENSIYDKTFFRLVYEIGVRILFSFSTLWLAWSIFSPTFPPIMIISVVFGASLLASLFFQKEDFYSTPLETRYDSFLGGKNRFGLVFSQPRLLPMNGPRGISNLGNNCWINSIVQALRVIPFFHEWLRTPIPSGETRLFAEFYAAYDEAIASGRGIVAMDTADLRAAFHQMLPSISLDPTIQIDAHEALNALLSRIPEERRGVIRETKYYSEKNLPPMKNPQERHTTSAPEFFLALDLPIPSVGVGQEARLSTAIERYLNDTNFPLGRTEGVERIGKDGVFHRYPLRTIKREIERAPQVLVISLKRYNDVQPTPSILQNIPFLHAFVPSPEPQIQKNHTPMQIEDRTILPTLEGPREYVLKSFIVHDGDSPRSGHYYAFGEENGRRYCFNDRLVTDGAAEWEEEKRGAYIFFYEAN